jgi:hypothetical protein
MVNSQDIEGYLIKMGISYDEIAKNTWMIQDNEDSIENLVVTLNDPVIVFHVKLMDIPPGCDKLRLFEELLKLNATDMARGKQRRGHRHPPVREPRLQRIPGVGGQPQPRDHNALSTSRAVRRQAWRGVVFFRNG